MNGFKVGIHCSNITEFYVLKSIEQVHFKEVELFYLTQLSCDFPRKQSFLSIYTSLSSRHAGLLSVLPDVSLDSSLLLTHTVLCLLSFSPWSPTAASIHPTTPAQPQLKPTLTESPPLTPLNYLPQHTLYLPFTCNCCFTVPSTGPTVGVQRYSSICM